MIDIETGGPQHQKRKSGEFYRAEIRGTVLTISTLQADWPRPATQRSARGLRLAGTNFSSQVFPTYWVVRSLITTGTFFDYGYLQHWAGLIEG